MYAWWFNWFFHGLLDIQMNSGNVKYSNFHITVNFNVDSEAHIGEMREAVEEMVHHPYLWMWLKQFDGTERVDFNALNKFDVERVRVRAAFEHGGNQNKGLHVHILVEVAHRTMVQVDKYGIDKIFEQFVHMKPNTHVRFLRGSGEDKDFILQYITKEVSCIIPFSKTIPAMLLTPLIHHCHHH